MKRTMPCLNAYCPRPGGRFPVSEGVWGHHGMFCSETCRTEGQRPPGFSAISDGGDWWPNRVSEQRAIIDEALRALEWTETL